MWRPVGRMSRLPCPDQHIAQVPEAAECANPGCRHAATEAHHALPKWATRSWKERDYALLYGQLVRVKVPVCHDCHVELTENRAMFVYTPESGFVWTELTERKA